MTERKVQEIPLRSGEMMIPIGDIGPLLTQGDDFTLLGIVKRKKYKDLISRWDPKTGRELQGWYANYYYGASNVGSTSKLDFAENVEVEEPIKSSFLIKKSGLKKALFRDVEVGDEDIMVEINRIEAVLDGPEEEPPE